MSDWAEDQDPYEILGLAQGHESTEAQIKKVCLLSRSDTPGKLQRYWWSELHHNLWLLTGVSTVGAEETS